MPARDVRARPQSGCQRHVPDAHGVRFLTGHDRRPGWGVLGAFAGTFDLSGCPRRFDARTCRPGTARRARGPAVRHPPAP
ncbi:hypothetical protein [Streptomyces sp. NPDC017673]|uniref:hypothetical protein n=1 Tax=unclassified Streptomyces TaxID=2593676 RepID=UPI0037B0B75B